MSGHDGLPSVATAADSLEVFSVELDGGFVDDLSCLSASTEGDATTVDCFPKSKAVPGVLGVFAADPNDAKAPDPRPKAEEALADATVFVFRGGTLLKALGLPSRCSEL